MLGPSVSDSSTRGVSSTLVQSASAVFQTSLIIPAGNAGATLGVSKWLYFTWNDQRSVTVAAVSSAGQVLWSLDTVGDPNGQTGTLTASGGTKISQTSSGPIVVSGRGAQDVQFAQALHADAQGYVGDPARGGGGSGPKQNSNARELRFIKPTDPGAGAVYLSALAWTGAVAVIIVATVVTAPMVVAVIVTSAGFALAVYTYNKSLANNPPPAPNCGAVCAPSPGGGGGGPQFPPTGPIGPPVMRPANTSGFTLVCSGAADGSWIQCVYQRYTN